MSWLLLCCLVALATCQPAPYELHLNPKRIYEYRYEGSVKFGLGLSNTAESGLRLTCNLRISGSSERTFVLQVSNLTFEEFNGFPGKNNFVASSKLAQHLSAQLAMPFMFDYAGGHVSNIRASLEVSDMAVNIVRGILSFFHMTLKTKERIYQLEEVSIHGTCQSTYVTELNDETKELGVTQVVDIDNCKDKATKYTGVATAVLDNISKQKGESIMSTVRYLYSVKPTADGGLITKAHSLERQFFTPFNVKGGNFKMQAVKEMVLLSVTDAGRKPTLGPMKYKGDLKYKFIDAGVTFPMIMENLNDPMNKAIELIKQLAEANKYDINSATTEDNMKLYQLLRVMPYEGLETMWKQFSGNAEQRNWFLDVVPEVNDARILRFLQNRFHAQDISTAEAVQALLLTINHLQPSAELVEMAKIFLTISNSSYYLWQTAMLTYGSLVYRNCAYDTSCPINTVQPLIDVAEDSLRNGDEKKMVTALKALGNAGHPRSIKTIMRFLPRVAASSVELPPSVLSAAVHSLRLIAVRDPHSVQDITLNLFLDKTLPAEIRMLAFVMLFETKPSMALVSTVATHLMEEQNLNIISPAYSYLKSLATSTTPENHFLSSVCNVAVKILGPKFGHLSYRYSKAVRLDWFNDDFLIGTAAELFMLRSAANVFPSEIIMKSKFLFIGRILELLELGVRAEGIMEMIRSADLSFSDLKSVFNMVKKWEALPNDKPILTAYSRVSGQEWLFLNINKDLILKVIKAFEPSTGKESPVWDLIHRLHEGWSWHRVKPFLTFETRYFQATSLGLPLEISKYYQSVSAITVNAKAVVNPPLTENLGQLLSSEVSLESDGFLGVTKDFWLFYGINTELFQCGSEFKSKIPISIPWRFTAKVNVKEKKFEMDLPLFKEEFEVASISSNVYAVNRNVEDPDKMTPFIPVALEASREVTREMEPEDEQMLEANSWHPSRKYCADSKIYGFGVCAVSELRRQYYHEEYPLYYFLGLTHMAIKAAPVQAVKPVEKIHLEFDAHSSQLLDTVRNSRAAAPQPWVSFRALAMSGSQRPEGFKADFYYSPETTLPNMQLNMSQVGENANWGMCLDSTIRSPTETKASIRWGAECQSYKVSVTTDTAHLPGSKPTIKASLDWSEIPVSMVKFGRRIGSYIPGMAFLYGFSQQSEINPQKEVSASVIVASADSVDVKVKFPEYMVSRQAIPFPLLPSNFCTFRNASLIAKEA